MSLDDLTRRLRALSDPLRLRLFALLRREEASVTDLVQVLGCGQSTISAHLSRLAEEGLVHARRDGRYLLYGAAVAQDELDQVVLLRAEQCEEALADRAALHRQRELRAGGGPEESVQPGRSWEAFARGLLELLPRTMRVADIGIGSGDMTLLLARPAERLIAIDCDEEVLWRFTQRARAAGLADRISARLGRLEDPPLDPGEVDLVLVSQVLHLISDPKAALLGLAARLAPGTQLLVFEIDRHTETWVKERSGHRHLGFDEVELQGLLEAAGFEEVLVRRAARAPRPPRFVTLLATARRARS